jgi:hypothetical protein
VAAPLLGAGASSALGAAGHGEAPGVELRREELRRFVVRVDAMQMLRACSLGGGSSGKWRAVEDNERAAARGPDREGLAACERELVELHASELGGSRA